MSSTNRRRYYALFLDATNYIEKCLTLIRFICNPSSRSLPHITMRIADKADDDELIFNQIKNVKVDQLNLIEVGAFNIEEQRPPYVVYINCESSDIEHLEYKPDFPWSNMHITMYKGNDLNFAQKVFLILSDFKWKIKLSFSPAKSIIKEEMGANHIQESFDILLNDISNEILKEDIDYLRIEDDKRIELIKRIIECLKEYKAANAVLPAESVYNSYVSMKQGNDSDSPEFNSPIIPPRFGRFMTPPEYAYEMAERAMLYVNRSDVKRIDFGDSSVGTGALFLAAYNAAVKYDIYINSALGIDINSKMVEESTRKFNSKGLMIWHQDCLLLRDSDFAQTRSLMLVNPPYTRSQELPEEYINTINKIAFEHTGISVSKRASLYVYHLLIMDKWLSENGIGAWLVPSSFLYTNYGAAVREYLTKNVTLLEIHVYDDIYEQFDNVRINTTLLIFEKARPKEANTVNVSYGRSALSAEKATISLRELMRESSNWRNIVVNIKSQVVSDKCRDCCKVSDLFEVKRGIATGANSFFVISRIKAHELGIPDEAIKPILPKARYIGSTIIERNDDGYPNIDNQLVLIDCCIPERTIEKKYPKFYEYLKSAPVDKNGKSILEHTLIKSRSPWYSQEQRLPPLYLLTYMGRDKANLPPLYFILNKSDALALNTYLLLYPKDWLNVMLANDTNLQMQLLDSLNFSARQYLTSAARVYSGALKKIEPNELKNMTVTNIPPEISNRLQANIAITQTSLF